MIGNIYNREKITSREPFAFVNNWRDYTGTNAITNVSKSLPDDRMLGVNIDNYHARKRRGELLPHTPFLQDKMSAFEWTPITLEAVKKSNTSQWWRNERAHLSSTFIPPTPQVWFSVNSSGAEHFVQAAAADIYAAGMDAGTSIAEMKQTAELVSGFSRRVGKLMEKLEDSKRGRKITPADIYNAYLEGRYGWRILAYEAKDLYDAVRNFDSERKLWTERRGYSYNEFDQGDLISPGSGTNFNIYGQYTGTWTVTCKHSVRGAVAALFEPSRFRVNPAETAWELVKFSFVVDMVISIGDAIRAGSLLMLAKGTTASIGLRTETTYNGNGTGLSTPDHPTYNRSVLVPYSATWSFVREQRIPTSISVKPTVHPHKYLAPLQALDMTALHRTMRKLR